MRPYKERELLEIHLNISKIAPGLIKDVYIIGAGASAHLGIPTGPELAEYIQNHPNELAKEISERIQETGHLRVGEKAQEFVAMQCTELARRLADAGSISIDEFLGSMEDDSMLEIAKLAISTVILNSQLNAIENGLVKRRCWLGRVLHQTGMKPREILEKSAFLTFNYDVMIETKAIQVLLALTGMTGKAAAELIGERVTHLHGSVYPLLTEPHFRKGYDVPLDGPVVPKRYSGDLKKGADSIRVIHESVGVDDLNVQLLMNAKRVFFLGFGFHRGNMRMLGYPHHWGTLAGSMYASAFDADAQRIVKQYFRGADRINIGDVGEGCDSFLARVLQ